jgi:hypothetical protein
LQNPYSRLFFIKTKLPIHHYDVKEDHKMTCKIRLWADWNHAK